MPIWPVDNPRNFSPKSVYTPRDLFPGMGVPPRLPCTIVDFGLGAPSFEPPCYEDVLTYALEAAACGAAASKAQLKTVLCKCALSSQTYAGYAGCAGYAGHTGYAGCAGWAACAGCAAHVVFAANAAYAAYAADAAFASCTC